MTIIRRLHLFHFLNGKIFYDSYSVFLVSDKAKKVRSFGRGVDWILDVVDNIIYERLKIGYFVDYLKFKKFLRVCGLSYIFESW